MSTLEIMMLVAGLLLLTLLAAESPFAAAHAGKLPRGGRKG